MYYSVPTDSAGSDGPRQEVGGLKFVGIDLAWGEAKPSGVAIVDAGGTVERARADLWTNEQICEFANLNSKGEEAVVAIDAPLIVNRSTPR